MPKNEMPLYQQIVDYLRAQILSGELTPGDKLPTEKALREQWACSNTVVKHALTLLRSEGLVESRRGSGTYVRDRPRLVRRAHSRDMRNAASNSTSPFARDSLAAGREPTWESHSEEIAAPARIAVRLGIEPGARVMYTTYRFLAEDEPIQLSDSHEPLSITDGTPVKYPERGPIVGVVARMDFIGVHIDRLVEKLTWRPAASDEAKALGLDRRSGVWVVVIERTYYAGDTPVETADIVFPADRYQLIYELPIDPWTPG